MEVYKEMAHRQLGEIINEAKLKWQILDCLIIHRYGKLNVNSKIVLVSCFSEHRKDSFESCSFIMDYLKKDAPFWKNEFYDKNNEWLENSN
jgi:molybdopterin synthase catalytic subunit